MSENEMNFDLHAVGIEIESLYQKERLRQKAAITSLAFNLVGFFSLLIISVVMQSLFLEFWFSYGLIVAFFILRLCYVYRKKEQFYYDQLCKNIAQAVN